MLQVFRLRSQSSLCRLLNANEFSAWLLDESEFKNTVPQRIQVQPLLSGFIEERYSSLQTLLFFICCIYLRLLNKWTTYPRVHWINFVQWLYKSDKYCKRLCESIEIDIAKRISRFVEEDITNKNRRKIPACDSNSGDGHCLRVFSQQYRRKASGRTDLWRCVHNGDSV